MDRKDLAARVLVGLSLCVVVMLWTGCSLPQKAQDDTKAKAEAERQKEEERKRLEAEIRAQLEKESEEKENEEKGKKAAEEAKKKEEEEKLAADKKKEAEEKAKVGEPAKKEAEVVIEAKAGAVALSREEYQAKVAQAKAKRQEENQKQAEAKKEKVRVQQVKTWFPAVSRNVRGTYCFADDTAQSPNVLCCDEYIQLLGMLPRAWDISEHERNTQIPRLVRAVLSADARNEKVTVNPDLILTVIPEMTTTEVLLDLHNNLIPPAIKGTFEREEPARRQRVISMSRVNLGLSSLQNADAMYVAQARTKDLNKGDATPDVKMQQEFQKALSVLPTEVRAYWKALNDLRHALAEREVLKQVQAACKARLLQLGVAAEQLTGAQAPEKKSATTAAPTTTTVPQPAKGPVTVYKLKDGRQIRAVMTVEMGDQLSLKDEAGRIEAVNKTDIVETTKESP